MKKFSASDTGDSSFRNFIKNTTFLASLTENELSELEAILVEKSFAKNDIILLEEDTLKFMYFIYSGKVKAVQISEDGKEQILAIHSKGEFFGEMSLLDGKTSPATVIAMEDSEIGLISKADFDRHILGNNKVLRQMTLMFCSKLREAWMRLRVLSFADSEHRIRAVLKLLSDQSGIKNPRGVTITIKLTHKDIAGYASVSRETVTRLIDRLIKDGEIEVIGSKNILLRPSFMNKTPLP
ncbi:MAG: Crp/Fnr family transcriptional regulator [Nitrospirae bacterium]|nr:Crp/Fnr family transcriptional regulator [Nitrospirota bacterium]